MNKILKYILIVMLCLSVFANFWLFMNIGYIVLDYEDEMYYNSLEWCEYSNDQSEIINELIERLKDYDEMYNEIELLEGSNCWGEE